MVLLFNKPWGVLCQFTDRDGRATLADFIPQPGVYAAGRLDRDSEGLLVLSDDPALRHRLTAPARKVPKTYWAQVEGVPRASALARLREGLVLADGPCAPAGAERIDEPPDLWPREPPIRHRLSVPTAWLAITLTEGRNRQVRRMTAAVGLPTLRLIRARVGEYGLGGLGSGEWREVAHGTGARRARRTL